MSMNEEKLSRAGIIDTALSRNSGVTRSRFYARYGKRIFDIIVVLALSPIAVTIIATLALALFMSGVRPFFVQKRLGKDGIVFPMIKLRTMVEDAETRLAAYLEDHPEERLEWNRNQKLRNDPRITPFGRFLRKSSLDELPQLINVLLGHMSLVGPRPMMVNQRDMYPGRAYFYLKPGITGYWQVSVRNGCEFRDRAIYDTKYYEEMNFPNDFNVLLSTVNVVVKGAGC